jgi:hypothetical protein
VRAAISEVLTARENMGAWAVRACISEVLVKCVQPMLMPIADRREAA